MIILASNLAGFFGYRLIGRITSRYSRRNVLSAVYTGVGLIFLGFAVFEPDLDCHFIVFIGFIAVFYRRGHR